MNKYNLNLCILNINQSGFDFIIGNIKGINIFKKPLKLRMSKSSFDFNEIVCIKQIIQLKYNPKGYCFGCNCCFNNISISFLNLMIHKYEKDKHDVYLKQVFILTKLDHILH